MTKEQPFFILAVWGPLPKLFLNYFDYFWLFVYIINVVQYRGGYPAVKLEKRFEDDHAFELTDSD
jgi:hypothetical protein